MSQSTVIRTVMPTPFLRRVGDALRQVARVTVNHSARSQAGAFHVTAQNVELVTPVALPAGESTFEVDVDAVTAPCEAAFALIMDGKTAARTSIAWTPPKRWFVHVVQLSHHDAGYTDLASHVIPEHDRWLDAVIDMATATRDFPDEARFRAVVEQDMREQLTTHPQGFDIRMPAAGILTLRVMSGDIKREDKEEKRRL